MKKGILSTIVALTIVIALTACASQTPDTELAATNDAEPRVLRMMTHDSFEISEETLSTFEEAHDVEIRILKSGDAGVMLNQAILSKENPLADVIYGIDNTLLSRALEEDILWAYQSPLLEEIPDHLEIDEEHRALPVDYGDVCFNYDRTWFAERELDPPASLEDLVDPAYESLTVVENPATSSPGLAMMLATIGHFGETGDYTWLDYWTELRANDVLVVDGWEDAYWAEFTYGSGGEGSRPIVASYASSPPVEVLFAEESFEEAPTAAMISNESCFRQIEFVGILAGTGQRDLAKAWIDYMLDETFQEDIPLSMFVFPANETAMLPDVFEEFAAIPDRPVTVDSEAIEDQRAEWLDTWTNTVLH